MRAPSGRRAVLVAAGIIGLLVMGATQASAKPYWEPHRAPAVQVQAAG